VVIAYPIKSAAGWWPLVRAMRQFVLNTMMISKEQWEGVSTRTIRREVRLCHLKALRELLSVGMRGGDPLADLKPAYRVVLGERERRDVSRASRDAASLEGRIVRARYKNETGWYRGRILRDRLNGTFDLIYTDGDTWLSRSETKDQALGSRRQRSRRSEEREQDANRWAADAISSRRSRPHHAGFSRTQGHGGRYSG